MMANVQGIAEAYRLLKENEKRKIEIAHYMGEGEPASIYQGVPTMIQADYIDEVVGNVLVLSFDDYSFEVTEQYFNFESGISTVNGEPYAPFIAITFKDYDDIYILIEFK